MVRWCSVCLVVAGCFSCGDRTAEQSGRSAVGVDYSKLEQLLADGNWKEADRETLQKMLEVSGRQAQGWLRAEDMEKFFCDDLAIVDRLWAQYSQGRFGFSTQQRLWENIGGKPGIYDPKIAEKFGDRVGWFSKGKWIPYQNLTFSQNAPPGHLPATTGGGVSGGIWGGVATVSERLRSCPPQPAFSPQTGTQPFKRTRVDYRRLEKLLKDENWREANQETVKLMLVLAEKPNAEVFEEKDLENFPCRDLKKIDRLWLDYSDGQYGFTVQQRVWKGVGGKPHTLWDVSIGEAFGDLVYWRRDGRWRDYFELSFDPIETPPGHLPIIDTDRTSWLVFGRGSITHWWIFSRMDTCGK